MGAIMSSASNVPKNNYLPEFTQIDALTAMTQLAKSLGMEKGVAFVSVQKLGDETSNIRITVVNKTIQRFPDPEVAGDTGTNYFAIAMAMLAVMMAAKVNSGSLGGQLRRGEVGDRGGLIRILGEYCIYTGFFGGTGDQNVQIADLGMKMMLTAK